MGKGLDTQLLSETKQVSDNKINFQDTKNSVGNILSLKVNDNAINNLLILGKIEEALKQIENNYEIIDGNIFIAYTKSNNSDTSKISTIGEFKNIKNLRPQTEIKLKTLIYFMKNNLSMEDLEVKEILKKISYFSSDISIKNIFNDDFKIIIHDENGFKLRKNHS